MRGFRKFVIGLADVLAIFAIVGATLFAAFKGGGLGYLMDQAVNARMYYALIYAITSGIVAFLAASLAAAFLFTLSDIAHNTRKTLRLLKIRNELETCAVRMTSTGRAEPRF